MGEMSNEECLITNIFLILEEPGNRAAIRCELISDFGCYIIIEPAKDLNVTTGDSVRAAIEMSDGEEWYIDSYISFTCYEGKRVCICLPFQLGSKDRRKHLRVTCELSITYKAEDRLVQSKSINVSAGGAYFFMPQRLEIGQRVQVGILLTSEWLILEAKVVRTMQNAATVEFCDGQKKIDTLAEFIYNRVAVEKIRLS